MSSTDLIFRFIGVDAGAGREFDRMGAKAGLAGSAIDKVALGAAAAGVAVAAESIKMAGRFQASMEVIHTQAGATQAEVARMSKAVLSLAGPTASAPEELAKGLYHLESTGLRGAKALEALRIAAEGAKVGGANLEDVTNALNAVIASGIKGAHNLDQAMGALNATVGAGDMRMQDLAEALGTGVLAVVKGFGVSLKDAGAALAVFGDNNIRGADAATQLRMSVLFLAEGTRKADGVLKGIGLSTKQLRNDLATGGLNKALTDLHSHLVKAGDTGSKMGDVLLQAFGHKAGVGLSVLEGQFGRFQNKVDEVGKGGKNFASDWKAYTETFGYSWDRAKAAAEAMLITLGTKLLPTATKAFNWIGTTGVQDLDKLGSWFSRNKSTIEDFAKALAAIAAFKIAKTQIGNLGKLVGVGGSTGVLGKADGALGTRVYVTNMPKSFPGAGGGGPLSTAEKDAEKYGPAAAAGATWLTRAAGVATKVSRAAAFADPMLLPVLTNAQDHGPQGNKKLDVEILRLLNQFKIDRKGVVYGPNGRAVPGDVARMVTVGKVNQLSANVSDKELNSLHVASVNGAVVPGTKAAKAEIERLNAALTDEWLTTKKVNKTSAENIRLATQAAAANRQAAAAVKQAAVEQAAAAKHGADNTIAQLRRIPGAMRQLAAEAKAAGTNIGAMLDEGITVGIQAGSGRVNIVTKAMVDGVIHTASKTAVVESPSKKTTYIGRMMADGVTVGITAGSKSAIAASKKLVDKVTAQLNNLRQTSASFASGIASNIMSGASLANVPTSSVTTAFGTTSQSAPTLAGITSFLSSYDAKTRAFNRNLALAGKRGLDKRIVADIAGLGVDQGGAVAAALAGGTRTQLRHINAIEGDINHIANGVGAHAANTVYGKEIADLLREQNKLLAGLAHRTGQEVAHAMTTPHAARTLATSSARTKRSK